MVDVLVDGRGKVFLLEAVTDEARAYFEGLTVPVKLGYTIACEPQFLDRFITSLLEAGFVVESKKEGVNALGTL